MAKQEHVKGPWVRTNEPLFWLGGCGHQHWSRADNYYFDSRKRPDPDHLVLQLTLSGAGFYERGGRRTLLRPGMAFFDHIPGDFRYGYPPRAQETYEQVYLSLMGSVAKRWWRRISRRFGYILTFGPGNPIAPLMLSIVRQTQDRSVPDRYLASAQIYQLMMSVLSTLNYSRVATAPLVPTALKVIETHARDAAFNVAALADELNCSREYLSRQFRSSTGVSPLDYLTQHRLRLAAHELRHEDEKLEAIAQRSGFGGANYLCRVFRKQYGLSPMEFRKRPWMLA
jgi:AraC-like DNA-binding protein